jgi:D-alanyl-D-alanine carboxypeptidase/D-alanyl-D-alanine-endopeptidase (penicillin-binding protein 4)
VDELFQVDGSGLSPVNAVSARFFVELLSYMQNKSKYADVFYKSLPVSGESGTLKSFLDKTSLQGKVHAKSGTIARVKSYVGYIECPDKTLVFALLINNANGTSREVTKKIEEILLQVSK